MSEANDGKVWNPTTCRYEQPQTSVKPFEDQIEVLNKDNESLHLSNDRYRAQIKALGEKNNREVILFKDKIFEQQKLLEQFAAQRTTIDEATKPLHAEIEQLRSLIKLDRNSSYGSFGSTKELEERVRKIEMRLEFMDPEE